MLSKQENVGLLVDAVVRKTRHAIIRRARPHQVSPQQFWVLLELATNSGLMLTQLAELHGLLMANASRAVSGLVARKLVKIQPDPIDRRKGHLELTASGTALARKLQREADEVRAAAEAGLDTEDAERLRALLHRVIANLDQLGGVRT